MKSSILIINYPEISAAIGVRNWMDASSSNWMTLPFLEALQILMDLVDFQYSWNIFVSSYPITMKVPPLDSH